jgi:sec-independent protein translocase protein TatB
MGTAPTIAYASLGMADSIILMIMALVVFGPRRLPQIGRQIGKLMFEFRKASNDFKFQMEEELRNAEEAERRKKEEERQRLLAAQVVPAQVVPEQASVSADPPAPVNAIESPYPGESHYPAQYPPETPAAAMPVEEVTPRIMPPSTGDTVPASRPSRLAESSEPPPDKETSSASQTSPEAIQASEPELTPSRPSDSAAEALNQHG